MMPAMVSSPVRDRLRRLLPLAVLVLALALFFGFGLHKYFDLDALRSHRAVLLESRRPANAVG